MATIGSLLAYRSLIKLTATTTNAFQEGGWKGTSHSEDKEVRH